MKSCEVFKKCGLPAAAECKGSVVVIDVLRAFTTAAYAFDRGATEILLVSSPNEGFELKRRNPELILVGEIDGRQIDGFDYGNSPEIISGLDLSGKTLVLRSTSGTQGVLGAAQANEILLGSFVVASATARYLRRASLVTFLAMGAPDDWNGAFQGDEDSALADYVAGLIVDPLYSQKDAIRRVRQSKAGLRAADPTCTWITPGDLERAVSVDRFDFVMRAERRSDGIFAAKRI